MVCGPTGSYQYIIRLVNSHAPNRRHHTASQRLLLGFPATSHACLLLLIRSRKNEHSPTCFGPCNSSRCYRRGVIISDSSIDQKKGNITCPSLSRFSLNNIGRTRTKVFTIVFALCWNYVRFTLVTSRDSDSPHDHHFIYLHPGTQEQHLRTCFILWTTNNKH